MSSHQDSGYTNKSGYIPGEFSEPICQLDHRSFNDDHIYVPLWETDDNFVF